MEIQHSYQYHERPLTNRNVCSVVCSVCGLLISGPAYCCTKDDCKYCIHKYCFELPSNIRHPFHPQHLLTLEEGNDDSFCNACGGETTDLFFQCSECEFDLDADCASLTPTNINNHGGGNEHPLIQHLGKVHPLILCNMNKNFKFYCNACTLPFEDSMIYVCLDCNYLLHKSCVELPPTIKHPFHPQHPLTLCSRARNSYNQKCNACGSLIMECYFGCYECLFQLDVRCASMMPANNHDEYHIQHLGQTHPMILCNMNKNFKLYCSLCTLPFEDLIYVCLECNLLLHESCFELAAEIKHSFHPQHPLNLVLKPLEFNKACSACGDSIDCCHYKCLRDECFFNSTFSMHTRCASSLVPTIRSKLHNHPLAFFNNIGPDIPKSEFFSCSVCSGDIISSFFRCVKCNFSLQAHCYPTLPQTIKYECHRHSLTFTNSPIKDYEDEDEEDAEFYCGLCKERRNLFEPTYYCVECQGDGRHYVAHFDCMISEILRALEEEWALTRNPGDKELETSTDHVVKKNIEEMVSSSDVVITKMESSDEGATTEKVEVGDTKTPALVELDNEILVLRREIEAQKAKLEALEERRAQLHALEMSDFGNKSD
ncbi:uncharacterized protein LOC132283083 [Cornus florida]|uniref:uncharacterized protein LOC132283083 n=1 Tax=Cornus florida TaxID=4283 RepID=UPI00289AE170|nr:uncharacterized protein LOC132283083 [Cornus florida]